MPEIPPDPDFRLADSDAAVALRGTADTLDAAAAALKAQERALAAANSGRGAEYTAEQINRVVDTLSRGADEAIASAQLRDACAVARDHFRIVTADATVADVRAAYEEWQALRAKLMVADNHHAALCRRRMAEAQAHYNDLLQRREDAVRGYEIAEDAATAVFQTAVNRLRGADWEDRSGGPAAPATAPDTPTAPAPAPPAAAAAPAPEAPAPAAGSSPEAAAPPSTELAAAPETATPAAPSGSGLSPAQAGLLTNALTQQSPVQQQAQPQMVPAMAMPAPALTPPQPQRPAEDPFANFDSYDPNSLLALLRAAPTTVAAPAIAPATLPEPETYSPATPWNTGLSGLAAVNPVVSQPVTTGTSLTGLTTDSNVTGRADGAAPRTATSPAPTHLAGAAAANAAANPAATAAHPGAGMGGTPIMGGPMGAGGMGGGGGKDREQVKATPGSDHFVLTGEAARSEAVPGGTIAQKRDDAA